MKTKGIIIFLFFGMISIFSKSPKLNSIYLDPSLPNLHIDKKAASETFHIFSHGKPGYLFIENHWLSAPEIAQKFKQDLKSKKELYIYGCDFGKGKIGQDAVNYLQSKLKISVNASTNITGKDGDWNLEIGSGKNGLKFPEYKADLQLDNTHYLNPIIAGSYNNGASIQEEFIYLSTPSTSAITIQMNYASGVGSPRISITDLSTNTVTYSTTGVLTLSNAQPIRIQFVDASNVVITPGTTPTTRPLNTGGTIISGNSAGLKFTTSNPLDKFYVNYRARSTAQAGSEMTKGVSALGKEFRWGGSPTEFATNVSDIGNMLSVMATQDNTTIVINNIKPGTAFVNGTGGTTLVGPSITKTLNKGDSFILYAPVGNNTLSIQDTGWLGAKVISDKDVAVVVGGLMQQGNSGGNRDIGFDQLVPVNLLGLEHVVMQGNGKTVAPEKVIVVATVDNTNIYVNGSPTAIATLAIAGDYYIIPDSNFNSTRNMLVRVSKPAYVFHKIYGFDKGNTNSLMFIPPLSCFGEKTVDLIPAPTDIGTTSYTGTELSILAATSAGAPSVTENGTAVSPYTTGGGGAVTGNTNWTSYRYKLTIANSNVKISSSGTIQAELFGANGNAGFGGYYSGFGDASSYNLVITSPIGYLCPDTGTVSVPSGLGTYQWFRDDIAIPGATNNSYALNGAGDNVIATYYVIITFPGGCSVRSNQVTSDTCPCTKASTTGTPDSFTKLGISIRDKRSTANWPNDVGNGFMALEGNKKGFVITRIASPETAISNPVTGMLIYNTTVNCLELYDGTSWKCIKPTCN